MKKLIGILLLLAVAMAGCFNQDKEKQEEKAVEQEKVVTKSTTLYDGVKIVLEQENKKYYLKSMGMYWGDVMGMYVTPTVDTDVTLYTYLYDYSTYIYNHSCKEEEGVSLGTAKLLKGRKYLVYCNNGWQAGMSTIEVIDTEPRFVVNEKNEMFKMEFNLSDMSWNVSGVNGNNFKIKDTQNNKFYFDGKLFTTLQNMNGDEVAVNPNKIYDLMIYEGWSEELVIKAEKSIEQFKVIGNILAKDYIGYYDFYSGMTVKITSEKNETVELPVVWNVRTNTFGIEANGLKYGTYKIKSTYQATRDGYVYGTAYEGDKVLVEYSIDRTMVIDSKSTSYPLPDGSSLINLGDISVTYKVVKNLSRKFTTLALCGVYNNWDIKGNMTYKGSNNWEGDIETKTLNNSVLFIVDKNWNKKYGDTNRDNIVELNKGDIKIQFAGKYHVVFNESTLKYTITLVSKTDLKKNFNEIAVYGAFNNWDTKGNMSFMGEHQWQYRLTVTSNTQIKFLGDRNGSYVYGDKNKDGVAEIGGTAIMLEKGSYQILFNDETLKYTLKKLS